MKRLLLLMTAAFAVWSCTKDPIEKNSGRVSYDPSVVMCFTTTVTRGTPVTDESQMSDLGVFCSYTAGANWTDSDVPDRMFDTKLKRNPATGAWEYDGTVRKWKEGNEKGSDRFSFFAYAPYASAANGISVTSDATDGGIPTLSYTVPADVTKQPDLMVAVPKYNLRPIANAVPLMMKHALTCVGFQIVGDGEQVTGISIEGVSMSGSLTMDGGNIVWDDLDDPAANSSDFSASIKCDDGQDYYTVTSTISTDLIAGNGYLMMIPQELGPDAKVIVTYSDDTTTEISLNKFKWESGKRVTYNINLTDATIASLFARSNIVMYVDEGGNKILTFAEEVEDNTIDKVVTPKNGNAVTVPAIAANVEGLQFRFGSLIGFSGSRIAQKTTPLDQNDIIFWPEEYTAPAIWDPTGGATTLEGQVPYCDDSIITGYNNGDFTYDSYAARYGAVGYDAANAYGDICRYISDQGWVDGRWRTPTQSDFISLYADETAPNGQPYANGILFGAIQTTDYLTVNNSHPQYGYTKIPNGRVLGPVTTEDIEEARLASPAANRVVFPAAVIRDQYGSAYNPGVDPRYWSSTAGIANQSYFMFLLANSLNCFGWNARNYGLSVRCIRDDGSTVPQETITVAPDEITLPAEGVTGTSTYSVQVTCTPQITQWTLTSADTWLTLSLSANGPGTSSVTGTGSQTVYLFATANSSASDKRTTTLNLGSEPAVDVTQLFPMSTIPYVGAFWRADQTGERLIRIPVAAADAGAWTAQVEAGNFGDFSTGDIVFSTAMSSDPNIGWRNDVTPNEASVADMNLASNDAAYQVTGNATSVSGDAEANSYIFFRIGLKSTWTATAAKPARYAVVVVTYGNGSKQHRIWLRQGHEPDFVMRDTDESTGDWVNPTRPQAGRFSPYNLTSPEYKYGRSTQQSEPVDIQGSPAEDYFTNYPSQAGAHYQFAPSYGVRAFHPTSPVFELPDGWGNESYGGYWNSIKNNAETCPAGYHRMGNGSASSAVSAIIHSESEISQSLYYIMGNNSGNSVKGYYADGFFDRRKIGKQNSNPIGLIEDYTAVATDTYHVAYAGRLFYNPINNASLFMPFSGYRWTGSPLGLRETDGGWYWTTSKSGITSNAGIWYFSSVINNASWAPSQSLAIRCVAD